MQQVSLTVTDVQGAQGRQFFLPFDTLGDHPAPEAAGDFRNGADKFPFYSVAIDGGDEVAVELDEIRAHQGPGFEP